MILTVNYRHRYDNYRRAGHCHLHVCTIYVYGANDGGGWRWHHH